MKKFFLALIALTFIAGLSYSGYVKGYYRKNGTYVHGYYRGDKGSKASTKEKSQATDTTQTGTNANAVNKSDASGNDQTKTEDKQDQTVYITRTGKCYHRAGCSSLRRSKIPIKKSEAIAEGYRPCSRCNP